ncbi:hypothetical protein [Pseudoruegeria sp. HB172150]|uniref:hypothetical protein n=1 Tax=Pseudoruegeria sp. HB172150 TaxID=2721164 RepID=UPI001552CE05|nr:hypothetical protein [Pseudoruegeria sp. HB172150]
MKLRIAICIASALCLAALTGAMENCGTLRACLADATAAHATAAAYFTDTGEEIITAEEALETDRRLTALIGG